MSRKIKHGQYEVVVNFKTDNMFSIMAEFLPTSEHFTNASVQLMRINKDTVIASLERKSEKNLKCEFEQLVQQGKKWLQIVFVVNFDFLPEFREEVRLEYVQLKESLKEIGFNNMRVQVDQMTKALESMEKMGIINHTQVGTVAITGENKEIWSKQVASGKYILRAFGTMANSQNASSTNIAVFKVKVPGDAQTYETPVRSHHQPSQHFPLFFSHVVNCQQGKIVIEVKSKSAGFQMYNFQVLLSRVMDVSD